MNIFIRMNIYECIYECIYEYIHLDSWQPYCPTSANAPQFQPLAPWFATDIIHSKKYLCIFGHFGEFFPRNFNPTSWTTLWDSE